jgi:hypothetical protein
MVWLTGTLPHLLALGSFERPVYFRDAFYGAIVAGPVPLSWRGSQCLAPMGGWATSRINHS